MHQETPPLLRVRNERQHGGPRRPHCASLMEQPHPFNAKAVLTPGGSREDKYQPLQSASSLLYPGFPTSPGCAFAEKTRQVTCLWKGVGDWKRGAGSLLRLCRANRHHTVLGP